MTAADLDAVLLDAYGTLVELERPVERLRAALARRGVERSYEQVAHAFRAEVAYYTQHKTEGRDAESLADLRRRCAAVLVEAADCAELDFVDDFVASLVFSPLPGVEAALRRLRDLGLSLAVVSNWDCSLAGHLDAVGLDDFKAVVTSAETGFAKPDAAIFRTALEQLGAPPDRVLHVGDQPEDEEGARAAGLRFAPAPVAAVVEQL